ncbi:energy-coupling factor ABC transporter substrate-binding protein [Oscillatoria sp. FACHB-1406]|uniref:energy-coupling factor ABC transporter substrate-binding protein n=1 Tax=Oscillatoria sp. FACHB-1406 TaxID=2692846 RepID=UPI001682C6D3|nr:energy-coupling factor ABC transporter substrate-binding protein [Oscillatoria sp. FACHB-1406]MBD2579872.1 energy-coupling factor ABC transporter substrate-binding protein [Oscillatoria sp. FACHB-1406]
MNRVNRSWNNWLLVLAVVGLAIAPLLLLRDAEFGGADVEATAAIKEVDPNYQPWVKPVFTPASGEIESLLFAVQAGLGAGVIGYVLGLYRGRTERDNTQRQPQIKPPRADSGDY